MWDNVILLRKMSNALLVFSVLSVAYGVVYYVAHLPGLFPVSSVRLSELPQNVSTAELQQVVRSEVRGNIFTVDIKRLRLSLEKLPWARSVSIRRKFPHGLAVQMEEHQAFARWNNGVRLDGTRAGLVNQYGEIFFAESKQALPGFIGQDGTSAEIAQHYALFNQQIAALGLSVAQIALSPRHAWQLRLSNGTVLELGREDMQQRLARFVAVQRAEDGWQRAEGKNAVKYVDLRYRNGFAVRHVTSEKG